MRKIYLFLLLSTGLVKASSIIYVSSYLDVENSKIINKSSIIVDGNRITDIKKGFVELEKDDVLYDLRDLFVMPGLMDGGNIKSKS